MLSPKKTGFTLVELLVVISIIGVLAAALITPITHMRETAAAAKCKANLRNLAQATQSSAVANEFFTAAGSGEYSVLSSTKLKLIYHERAAWVQWTGGGNWGDSDHPQETSQRSSMTPACFYGDDAFMSISNGVLWDLVGKDLASYVCGSHKILAQKKVTTVLRSYVMNGYFGYCIPGSDGDDKGVRWRSLNDVNAGGNAQSLLLFAELPSGIHPNQKLDTSTDAAKDGVLETKIEGSNADGKYSRESIGFNHVAGKQYIAHVVFADGHVDALHADKSITLNQMQGLTYFLCNGKAVPGDPVEWNVP